MVNIQNLTFKSFYCIIYRQKEGDYMKQDDNKISCCTIVADCITPNVPGKSSYAYHVPFEDAYKYMNFINETFAYFGQPCERIYVSGFIITTNSSVWDKERIFTQIKMVTEQKNVLREEKIKNKIR